MKWLLLILLLLPGCKSLSIGYNPITKEYYNRRPTYKPDYCKKKMKLKNTKNGILKYK